MRAFWRARHLRCAAVCVSRRAFLNASSDWVCVFKLAIIYEIGVIVEVQMKATVERVSSVAGKREPLTKQSSAVEYICSGWLVDF